MPETATARAGTSPRQAALITLVLSGLAVAAGVWVYDNRPGPVPPPADAQPVRPPTEQLADAEAQAGLVAAEDARLAAALDAITWDAGPFTVPAAGDEGPDTTVLTPSPVPYDLGSLLTLGAAERVDDGTVRLVRHVLVAPDAQLSVKAPGTTLELLSGPGGFTSVVGWKGSLSFAGADGQPLRLTSWDPSLGAADTRETDGRAYVRTIGAQLSTRSMTAEHLGFWSGRTGGLAITGSSGVPGSGLLDDTVVRASHYGLFSSDAAPLSVTDSSFTGSTADGVLLHRGTSAAVLYDVTATGNGGHGVAVAPGATDVTVSAARASANGEDGIRVNGSPLAEEAGPGGAALSGFAGFDVVDSVVSDNLGNGITAVTVDEALLARNDVSGNTEGIVVRGAADDVTLRDNEVSASDGAGIAVRDGGREVVVEDNLVAGAETAVQVRDSVVDVTGNTVEDARAHGVSVIGAAHGSSVTGNTVDGTGPSGIDLYRLDTGASVDATGNSEETWTRDRDLARDAGTLVRQHPLLLLWFIVLAVPTVAHLVMRRRRHTSQPYATGWPTPGHTIEHVVEERHRDRGDSDGSGGSRTRVTVVMPR